MPPPPDVLGSLLEQLSDQERAVLDLGVEGRTDEQIAQALNIRPSTVNSYWARIRGKVGPYSRSELAAMVFKQRLGQELAHAKAENLRLKEELRKATLSAGPTPNIEASWWSTALNHSPHATFVAGSSAQVIFANHVAGDLYRTPADLLKGLALGQLWSADFPPASSPEWEPTGRETLGLDKPVFGIRPDGSRFQALLQKRSFRTDEEVMTIVTVQDFYGEVLSVIDMLRASALHIQAAILLQAG